MSKLSEGAFGRTFIGRHSILSECKVCIKQEKTGQADYQKLFREEAEMLWKLSHPSLPHIKDYIVHPDPDIGHIMVLSFIEGQSLDTVVGQGTIADEHLCWILDRIMNALSYLHYGGLIHSDLKPENVILDIAEHNATLVDLGMAVRASVRGVKAKGGTPCYMPPEFELGKSPTPASDIYSLGIMALYMSGGNIQNGEPPTDMHPKLKDFVNRMIRRNPESRPQDVDAIRTELFQLRKEIWGRSSCLEIFKRRSDK